VEHQDHADQLEGEADKMEQESQRVEGRIEESRRDWEAKEGDVSVPGAQPNPEEVLREEPGDDDTDDTDEQED
jgi:hypothetical protein